MPVETNRSTETRPTAEDDPANASGYQRIITLPVDHYWHPALRSDSICYTIANKYISTNGFIKKGNIGFEMLPFDLATSDEVAYELVLKGMDRNIEDDVTAIGKPGKHSSTGEYEESLMDPEEEDDTSSEVTTSVPIIKAENETSRPPLSDEQLANIEGLPPGAMTLFADFIAPDSKYSMSIDVPAEAGSGSPQGMVVQTSTPSGEISTETMQELQTIGETVIWVPFQNMDAKYPLVYARSNMTKWFNHLTYEYAPEELVALYDKYSGFSADTSTYQYISDITITGANEIARTLNSKMFSRRKGINRENLKTTDFVNLGDRERVVARNIETDASKEIITANDLRDAASVTANSMQRTNY